MTGDPSPTLPKQFVAGMVIDAVGSGSFLPFALVYFTRVQGLRLGSVGIALALTNAALFATSAPLGELVRRWRPLRALVASSLMRSVLLVLIIIPLPALLTIVVLTASTTLDKVGWVAQGATAAQIAGGPQRRRHAFSTLGWSRNVGLGVGALLGGVAHSSFGDDGLRFLAFLNALSFVIASYCLSGVRSEEPHGTASTSRRERRSTTLQMLKRRGFVALFLAKTCFTSSATAISLLMGASLLQYGHLPSWGAGAAYALNAGGVVLLQPSIVRRTVSVDLASLLLAGGLLYASAGAGFLLAFRCDGALGAVGLVTAAILVYTLGEIVIAPASDTLATELAETGKEAPYLSLYQSSWSISSVVVPALGAPLIAWHVQILWLAFVALGLVGALCALRLVQVTRGAPGAFSLRT